MKKNIRNEEIQDIIEKMPNKFGYAITGFIASLVFIVFTFGFIIKYPDIVSGAILIRNGVQPVRLLTKNFGYIKLIVPLKQNYYIHQGDYLAYLDNATNVSNIYNLKKALKKFEESQNYQFLNNQLKFAGSKYGELTSKVSLVQGTVEKMLAFNSENIYQQQYIGIKSSFIEENNLKTELLNQIKLRKENLFVSKQVFTRDSILLAKDLISEQEFEKSKQLYLNNVESVYNLTKEEFTIEQKLKDLINQGSESNIQKTDKLQDLTLQFHSYLNDLNEGIKDWEQKYVIVSPINGKLQIFRFFDDNQFLKSGEELFAVLPNTTQHINGTVEIPGNGSGKIKVHQKVIVKLEDYPFKEFGSIQGFVQSISSIPRTVTNDKAQEGNSYLVTVTLPQNFTSNFGKILDLKPGSRGSAEIITDNRKLIERVFSTIRHSTK